MPVAVVIYKCTTGPPSLTGSCDAGFLRNLCEHPAIVVVKPVLAVVRDVEIFPSVIVVVADAHALAPAGSGQPGFNGHVGERAVVIVAIQTIRRTLTSRKSFEPRSVHQENIEPAIVVVIEYRDCHCRWSQ